MSTGEEMLEQLRPGAFAIAYRMLGSVAEAEDVVQEALLRLHQTLAGGEEIASPRAFVATITTRLAIDQLRSARVRREQYVGEWLPEPLLTDPREDPAARAELADSLSVAMLVLLERLSPEQRAALLLHDVFDYGYEEIAEMLGKSEAGVRQLASRARRHVGEHRPRFQATREQRDELASRFISAAQEGDLAGLEMLLAPDAVLTGDGGGKAPALARSLHGRNRVARTLVNWLRATVRVPGFSMQLAEINAGPGVLLFDGRGRLFSVWTFEVRGGEVTRVDALINPDKLAHLGPVVNVTTLVEEAPEG